MRGLWRAVAQVAGEAGAVDGFGCVQDGEEPKGEVVKRLWREIEPVRLAVLLAILLAVVFIYRAIRG